jgi:hypothetical protein
MLVKKEGEVTQMRMTRDYLAVKVKARVKRLRINMKKRNYQNYRI